jgi:HK97 gp10 family phage protein
MPTFKTGLVGMKECREALQQLDIVVARAAGRRALQRPAEMILAAVRATAPVSMRETNPSIGSLQASGKIARHRRVKQLATVAVIFEDPAAVPYEYGTTKQPARPWFRVAVDAIEPAAIAVFGRELRREVLGEAAALAAKSKAVAG